MMTFGTPEGCPSMHARADNPRPHHRECRTIEPDSVVFVLLPEQCDELRGYLLVLHNMIPTCQCGGVTADGCLPADLLPEQPAAPPSNP